MSKLLNIICGWLSFKGKMTRRQFWLSYVVICAALYATQMTGVTLISAFGGRGVLVIELLVGLVTMAIFASLGAFFTRRLRDAGLGWWPLALLVATISLTFFSVWQDYRSATVSIDQGSVEAGLSLATQLGLIATFITAAITFWGLTRPSKAVEPQQKQA